MSRETWYRKGDLSTVIFVPATPRSQLKHRYMKEIKETVRCNPQKNSTKNKVSCRSTCVTCELVCQACKHKYTGETSRSAYTRGKKHRHELEQREESSVMRGHSCDKHGGAVPDSVMNVAGIFHSDAMLRQITESVMILKK